MLYFLYSNKLPYIMCGIIAVSGVENASYLIYEGLKHLQHRGQESAGILVYDGQKFKKTIKDGMVQEAISPKDLKSLNGTTGLGHVRYSTSGRKKENGFYDTEYPRQPIVDKDVAVVHNGTVINYNDLADTLRKRGISITSGADSDTQLLTRIIGSSDKASIEDRIKEMLDIVEPTYSMIIQHDDTLYICRDKTGNRPLYFGNIHEGHITASEERVLKQLGATNIREVNPGELIRVSGNQSYSEQISAQNLQRCMIELIYLASAGNPEENPPYLFNKDLRKVRKGSGMTLAKEQPADADLVIGILGSGYYASLGYSEQSNIPYSKTALIRDPKFQKRIFIEPNEKDRIVGVYLKFLADSNEIVGKRVVAVDDTIVRLTTSSGLVQKLRLAGVSELHMRIASPPISWPCFYGIDFPKKDELIAARLSILEINQYLALRFFGMEDRREELIGIVKGNQLSNEDIQDIINRSTERDNYLKREFLQKTNHTVIDADNIDLKRFSLGYLSLEGLIESFDIDPSEYCLACFTGNYKINPEMIRQKLEIDSIQ